MRRVCRRRCRAAHRQTTLKTVEGDPLTVSEQNGKLFISGEKSGGGFDSERHAVQWRNSRCHFGSAAKLTDVAGRQSEVTAIQKPPTATHGGNVCIVAERAIRRHRAWLWLTHWRNALCLALLAMSGMQVFNAHPSLYLGLESDFTRPLLSIGDGFPHWLTLPGYQDLAEGRLWHFFLAWISVLNRADLRRVWHHQSTSAPQ
jgi:hypothetical protein